MKNSIIVLAAFTAIFCSCTKQEMPLPAGSNNGSYSSNTQNMRENGATPPVVHGNTSGKTPNPVK